MPDECGIRRVAMRRAQPGAAMLTSCTRAELSAVAARLHGLLRDER
jgi:hypothetical protein